VSVIFTDTFSVADGDLHTIIAGWVQVTGQDTLQIVSGVVAKGGGGNDACYFYDPSTWPNDQYGQTTLGTPISDGVGTGFGPALRINGAGNSFYRMIANASGYELARIVSGSNTLVMASGSGTTFANGDIIYLEMNGSTPTMKKNGTSFGTPTADSTHTAGDVGICYSSTVSNFGGVDAFEGGSLAAPATYEQEGYRWRNDDGSESAATWKASQDTTATTAVNNNVRVRFLINRTG
jgi:hypothetical protein